jgi:S-adenosylmethionine hydrolase
MAEVPITLTTDFGEASPYVAAMKGVILSLNPHARLFDLSHAIAPQDLRHTAFFLRAALPYFPPETIHVIVVDPGVGTDRAALYVEVGGQRLLVPDNGCWTELARGVATAPLVLRLTEPRYWRPWVSATFHGRDVFAPTAAHLSLGVDARQLGQPMTDWIRLELPEPLLSADKVIGEVVYVDTFGNLITNVPGQAFIRLGDRQARLSLGGQEFPCHRVRTYGEAPPGTLVALVSSADTLEIAVVQGSAARQLGANAGTAVVVTV